MIYYVYNVVYVIYCAHEEHKLMQEHKNGDKHLKETIFGKL